MNHLSHLFLTGNDHHLLLGNLIADFIKPNQITHLSSDIVSGIKFHQFIDQSIDTNEVFRSSIGLLRKTQGKYAPVVADMFYDYLLVDHWAAYADRSFDLFKSTMYESIEANLQELEDEIIIRRVNRMISNDFLSLYKSAALIPTTFGYLQKRARFPNHFDQAEIDFNRLYPELAIHFNLAFPEMVKKTEHYRLNLQN